MAEKKGKKLRRSNAKTRAIYAIQFGKTEVNKRRKMGRHIRHHPLDQDTIQRYEKDMGKADGHLANLTSEGEKLAQRNHLAGMAVVAGTAERITATLRKKMQLRHSDGRRVSRS
jgi:hypothetical protein